MFALTYRKPTMIFLAIVGLIMFIGSILYFLGFNVPFDSPPYFQIIFGFCLIAILPYSIYSTSKKNFSTHSRLQEKIIYVFTDEKIKQIGESFNSEMDWSKIYKIIELKGWILIYQNRQTANLIPKEFFGDNISEFRELVKKKGIKAKMRK